MTASDRPVTNPRAPLSAEYEQRRAARAAVLASAERRHLWLSRFRMALVVAFVVLGVMVGLRDLWAYGALVGVFVIAAIVHGRVLTDRLRQKRAVAYYEHGLDRLHDRWVGRGDGGDRYRPVQHLYADDLDVFGRGSLFELICTAQTQPGQDTLAAWLLEPAPPAEAVARQAAVRDLAPRLDLRERLALEGDAARANRLSSLRAWAARGRAVPVAARVTLVLTATLMVVIAIWTLATSQRPPALNALFLLAIALQLAIVAWLHGRVHALLRSLDVPVGQLALLAGVLATIEQEGFTAPRLLEIRASLGGTTRPASAEIAKLEQLIAILESRQNIIFALPAGAVAWGTQVGGAIDAWRRRVGPHIVRWIDAVGEFEALAAMAGYAAERPGHAFPTFAQSPVGVDAVGLAHPLLPADAVGNAISIGGPAPHVYIVSGSNMSGKSTFLRALGANVVLAQMGLPVRATALRMSPLAVGASIRVLDSLQEGHSRFFAEIRRLSDIVALARGRAGSVLFLLDEILGGTNSHDRLRGAEGVIAGLVSLGAIGLVTTHDLALGDVTTRLPVGADNVHFADQFDAGGLHFDYHLRPGLVRTSNALALMRAVGLEVDS